MAQYNKYWGDQLVPRPVYDDWVRHCLTDGYSLAESTTCLRLEKYMDMYIGKKVAPGT